MATRSFFVRPGLSDQGESSFVVAMLLATCVLDLGVGSF
jgi:hypothetical protein